MTCNSFTEKVAAGDLAASGSEARPSPRMPWRSNVTQVMSQVVVMPRDSNAPAPSEWHIVSLDSAGVPLDTSLSSGIILVE